MKQSWVNWLKREKIIEYIGSYFFNGNAQDIQKLGGECEQNWGNWMKQAGIIGCIGSNFFNGNVQGIQKTGRGV